LALVVWFVPLIRGPQGPIRARLYEVRQAILQERQLTNRLHRSRSCAFDRPETIEWLARTLANQARTNEVVFQFADE
jgi:hypothetical protein